MTMSALGGSCIGASSVAKACTCTKNPTGTRVQVQVPGETFYKAGIILLVSNPVLSEDISPGARIQVDRTVVEATSCMEGKYLHLLE